MGSYLKLLIFILLGLFLLWLFFSLYLKFLREKGRKNEGRSMRLYKESIPPDGVSDLNGASGSNGETNAGDATSRPKYKGTENSGGLMICPICLFRMDTGEMIKTKAFPPLTPESKDRLMHIHGCVYCRDGKRERICPVCGKTISVKDFLIARIFDRSIRRSHVHVLGCTQCRPLKTM